MRFGRHVPGWPHSSACACGSSSHCRVLYLTLLVGLIMTHRRLSLRRYVCPSAHKKHIPGRCGADGTVAAAALNVRLPQCRRGQSHHRHSCSHATASAPLKRARGRCDADGAAAGAALNACSRSYRHSCSHATTSAPLKRARGWCDADGAAAEAVPSAPSIQRHAYLWRDAPALTLICVAHRQVLRSLTFPKRLWHTTTSAARAQTQPVIPACTLNLSEKGRTAQSLT